MVFIQLTLPHCCSILKKARTETQTGWGPGDRNDTGVIKGDYLLSQTLN